MFNQMLINHIHTDIHTHIFTLQCQHVCPNMTQATRRHCPHLWHTWHLPHTRPANQMAQQHLHSSKTLTLKAFQLWDTWSPELTSLERKATLKDPYPPPKSTQNMQSCDGQCFGNTRAHQSRISSHFYLSCQTETFEHCAPLHLQASFSSAPINGQFSVVPPSFTTLQMQSFQEEKKGGKKKNTSSESYKQV